MTYVTNTDGIPGVGKAVTFNAPGIGGVIEALHNITLNPRDYDNLVTDYVNESDVIGNYAQTQQLGTTQYIRSQLGSTAGQDVGDVLNLIAATTPLGSQLSPLEKLELALKAFTSGKNIAQNALPTGNHGICDMVVLN